MNTHQVLRTISHRDTLAFPVCPVDDIVTSPQFLLP